MLLHYSEDPGITAFTPHVPRTNPAQAAAVWAIDAEHAALYWFPRDCPRVAVWAIDAVQQARLTELFATDASRVHSVPREWHDAVAACALYEYRFDSTPFESWPDAEGQWIAHEPVTPVSVEPVGDLIARHASAGVELRFVADLAAVRAEVLEAGLPFSIVRFRSEPERPP